MPPKPKPKTAPRRNRAPRESADTVYELRLIQTQDATGYFTPVPRNTPDLPEVLTYLKAHPNDEFMHRYGLRQVMALPREEVDALAAGAAGDRVLMPLLLEACLLCDALSSLQDRFPPGAIADLRHDSPLVLLRSSSLPDQARHREWITFLKDNLLHHQPLRKAPEAPPPSFEEALPPRAAGMLADAAPFAERHDRTPDAPPSFETVAAHALQRLETLGILSGGEMRHENSLSPIALLRRWRLAVRVAQDRHRFRLEGLQTAYGKGLSLERARASCAMEIVERVSAFASVVDGRLPDLARECFITRRRLSEVRHDGFRALDPNTLALEVPYEDQAIYWIPGETCAREGSTTCLVPFQSAVLFANLDEAGLFSGIGSTGLAAGWSPSQAKFHALLECLERDTEAVTLFDTRRCFRLATRDDALAGLLAAYRRQGIDVFFQDCSDAFGVPCYRCFVYGPGPRDIAKGASAHFTGWQAALSALTEAPYPFPRGPASRPGPDDLPLRYLEDLPDFASGSVETDLHRLETLLAANGYHPVYVELTRRDIQIPVVRALVPGLELVVDFDRYARVSPRLYRNYRRKSATPVTLNDKP